VYVPSGQFTVTDTEYFYGYIQGWLEASAGFDLRLQQYSGSSWSTVATSSGGAGSEWMQFATSGTFLPPPHRHPHHAIIFVSVWPSC
jgi:hypothetical protein